MVSRKPRGTGAASPGVPARTGYRSLRPMNVGILWEVLLNYRATAKRIPQPTVLPAYAGRTVFCGNFVVAPPAGSEVSRYRSAGRNLTIPVRAPAAIAVLTHAASRAEPFCAP